MFSQVRDRITTIPGSGWLRSAIRWVSFLGLVGGVLWGIRHSPLDGPVGGLLALLVVLVSAWFAGPGPAMLFPLMIWLVSRADDVARTGRPERREVTAFLATSLLMSAVGLAGQYRRRLSQSALQHARRMREQRRALGAAHILFRELDGRITGWTDGVQRMFGYTPLEAIGRNVHELLRTRFPQPLGAVKVTLLREGQWQGEVRVTHKSGAEKIIACHWILYRDDEGRPAGVAETYTNITELRAAEAAVREADRRKDLFIATLAHELRNPLSPIRSGLDLLRLSSVAPDDAEIIDVMQRQLSHMVRLIDDLLDVGRINTGRLHLRHEACLLGEIIRDAVEACRPLIEEAGHQLEVHVTAEPVEFVADPARVTQVVTNLLNNAAKFTPDGGVIKLTAGRQGEQVLIRVQDNGIGIAGDRLAGIFTVFNPSDELLRHKHGGLGLGLSIVRSLVELHGGQVTVQSSGLSRGTAFEIRLPVESPARRPPVFVGMAAEPLRGPRSPAHATGPVTTTAETPTAIN